MDKLRKKLPLPHKDTPQWFELKISKIMNELRNRFFSYAFYLKKKTIRNDTGIEALIDVMGEFEEHLEEYQNCITSEVLDVYQFLKRILERNASLWGYEKELFGPHKIKRDRSGISVPQKNEIAVQCAAQILWDLEGEKIPTIDSMTKRLTNRALPLFDLLSLERFNNSRTIETWVSPIYPVPQKLRKRSSSRKKALFADSIPIPGIHSEKGANFLKLRFAAGCIARILKTVGWGEEKILESKFIGLLAEPLPYYLTLYLNDWVKEAYLEQGSIFAL